MNTYWHILYCDASANFCPISEFIEKCQQRHQAKIFHFMNLLATEGPNLPRPYADLLRNGIHELRIKLSGSQARFLYFFTHHNYIIMYIAFYKTTDQVPDKYIRRTLAYRDKFKLHITRNYLENVDHANN